MNKNKISPLLLEKVGTLSVKDEDIIVESSDFNATRKLLDSHKILYKAYEFINCFSLKADTRCILDLSKVRHVKYITSSSLVLCERKETDFMHVNNLTQNKFLGQNVTICFIDTGINPHFDFIFPYNRIIKFIDLVNGKQFPYDDNGHGTFVTGICCGKGIVDKNFEGFAPNANIISIKALNKDGNADSNLILDAMKWVYENHKIYNIKIVNMSFGAEANLNFDPLSKGAEALWKRGITVVVAAGNSGPKTETIKSPGNNPNIITVGGIDLDDMSVATFSSRGPTVFGHKPDLLAPAVNIRSCDIKNPYTNMSGTSVATPIVSGICACIISRYPKAKNTEIKKFLMSNCRHITFNLDIEGAGFLDFENLN